ncbi:MAG: ketopantoate reductase family protein, partial [Candidatus Thorarchaeota archaeon]
ALGITLTTDNPVRYTLGTAKATSANINSMLQDLLAHKQTEVDYITGAVIKYARELGIDTPISESVYALIKAIESKYLTKPLKKDEMIVSVDELLRAIIPETSS